MRRVEHRLNTPTVAGTGDPQECRDYVDKWVEVSGTLSAGSLKVQGRLSAAWFDIATVSSVPAKVECAPPYSDIRLDTTLATGVVVGTLVARDGRTE